MSDPIPCHVVTKMRHEDEWRTIRSFPSRTKAQKWMWNECLKRGKLNQQFTIQPQIKKV